MCDLMQEPPIHEIDGCWSIDWMWRYWLLEWGAYYYDGWHYNICIGPLRISKSYNNQEGVLQTMRKFLIENLLAFVLGGGIIAAVSAVLLVVHTLAETHSTLILAVTFLLVAAGILGNIVLALLFRERMQQLLCTRRDCERRCLPGECPKD